MGVGLNMAKTKQTENPIIETVCDLVSDYPLAFEIRTWEDVVFAFLCDAGGRYDVWHTEWADVMNEDR